MGTSRKSVFFIPSSLNSFERLDYEEMLPRITSDNRFLHAETHMSTHFYTGH